MASLPWHAEHWARFCRQIATDRLPHAFLIAGPVDTGKTQLAEEIAGRLLCTGSHHDEPACGQCARCHLLTAGTHPDLYQVGLEDSRQIKVEQIRELIHWAQQTSQQGGRKVCILHPAEAMNIAAANAFLKSLEEPPADTVLLLVTDQPSRLLPTIRSRCQLIPSENPPREMALQWLSQHYSGETTLDLLLEIAGGSPLRAINVVTEDYLAVRQGLADDLLQLADGKQSPIQLAASLTSNDSMLVLELLYQLVSDSIGWSLSEGAVLKNRDLEAQLTRYAKTVPVEKRYAFIDRIQKARGMLSGTSNANAQMLLEWVLVDAD